MTPTAQFGTGSPLLGGTQGLAQSMLGGNMPGGEALNQQSPSSVGFDPNLQIPQYPPMPQGSPIQDMHLQQAMARRAQNQPQAAPQGAGAITLPVEDSNPQQPGVQIPMSEAALIIGALKGRLGHLSKHEEHMTKVMHPLPPAETQ